MKIFKKFVLFMVLICAMAFVISCGNKNSDNKKTVSITLPALQEMYIGKELKLNADVENSEESVKWSSSKTDVATVDESGNVKALSEGTSNIFAKIGDVSAYCRITVIDGDSLEVNQTSMQLTLKIPVGGTGETEKSIIPTAKQYGVNLTSPNYIFSSNDETVAIVGEDGKVEAKGVGKASVSVKIVIGERTFEKIISVEVTKARIDIEFAESNVELGGENETINLTLPQGFEIPENCVIFDADETEKRELVYTVSDGKLLFNKYSEEKIDGIDKYQLSSGNRKLIIDIGDIEYVAPITVYTKIIMTPTELAGVKDQPQGIRFYSLHDRATFRTEYLSKKFDGGKTEDGQDYYACDGGFGVTYWNAIDKTAGIPVPEDANLAYIYQFGGNFVIGANLNMESSATKRGNMYDWCGYTSNGNNWQTNIHHVDSGNTSIFGFHGIIDGRGYTISRFKAQKNNGSALGMNLGTSGIVKNIAFDDIELPQASCGFIAFSSTGTIENITMNQIIVTKADGTGVFDARGAVVGKPESGTYKNIIIINMYYKSGLTWGTKTGSITGYGKGNFSDIYVIGSTKLCKDDNTENPRNTDNLDTVKGFLTTAEYTSANIDFTNWDTNIWSISDCEVTVGEVTETISIPKLKTQNI